MSALVAWSAKNRLLALMLSFAIALAGVLALRSLPIDAVPDVTNTQVQVVTRAPALSAREVETQVTQPVERAMAGLPGLSSTRSVTKLGISIVTLVFEDGTDVYFARAQVNERVASVRDVIPPDVGRPELGPVATGLGEIFMLELRADPRSPRSPEELRTIVDWQLAPRLRQVPGVVEVVGYGGAVTQYRVTLLPSRLAAHAISADDVKAALLRDNRGGGGGFVERGGEQIVLRGDARFRGIEDVKRVVVRVDDQGVPLHVGQLAQVDTGPSLRQGAMTRDGRGEIVGASVLLRKGENGREVTSRVKAALAAVAPSLPEGVTVEPWYDRSDFIDGVLTTIAKNLSEGALIVVGCLLLTLGSLRAGLLVAGAIPFSLLVAFIGLRLLGHTGNVMSLGAVDFGIVVEGAVLSVEHAMSHGASIADRRARKLAIVHAMKDVARPALFVVVITALVFLPLATLEDVEGRMFRPVVVSLCFLLLGAILYALVFLPAVGPILLRASAKEPLLARLARRAYEPLLARVLVWKKTTLAVAFGATVGLLSLGGGLGADFLPRMFEGSFALDALRPPSTSLTQAIALSRETEVALRELPEVKSVVSRIGRPEGAVDPAGPESSDVFVLLHPRERWRPGVTPASLADEVAKKVGPRVPATQHAVSQPIEMRVNDLVAGVKSDIAVKVFGDDLDTMRDGAERVRRALASVPGAADVKMEIPTGLPSIAINVDRDRAARLGVQPMAALDALAMARAGLPLGVVREGERVFDLSLRLGGDEVSSARDLARLPIATARGNLVPIAMIAAVEEEDTVVQIGREQMQRRIIVSANVRGRDMVGFVEDAKTAVASAGVPRALDVRWGGQFENFTRAKDRLVMLVPISLAVIGVMLVVTFRSAKYALMTLLSLPFAVAGGVLGLWLRGLPFSIPAGVGFIALAGVSVTTGIVMTSNLLSRPLDEPPETRVREAALASLRARISTALIAAIGFVPAALATGTGAEVQRPLATVVIGGLAFSMIVSLAALPVMLLYAARTDRPRRAEDDEDEKNCPTDAQRPAQPAAEGA